GEERSVVPRCRRRSAPDVGAPARLTVRAGFVWGAQIAAPITAAAEGIEQIELIVKIAEIVDPVKEGLDLLDDAVRIKRACVHGMLLSVSTGSAHSPRPGVWCRGGALGRPAEYERFACCGGTLCSAPVSASQPVAFHPVPHHVPTHPQQTASPDLVLACQLQGFGDHKPLQLRKDVPRVLRK